jgi:hypothetical protein
VLLAAVSIIDWRLTLMNPPLGLSRREALSMPDLE